MTAIAGTAAAVTGAASGIGRALALELAARGCDLALADRDEAGLRRSPPRSPKPSQRKVTLHRVDVGVPAQIEAFAQAAIAAHPWLNIVINNAGVALIGIFNEVDQAQMEWLININFWGVVHGTRAFLPHLSTTARGAHRQPLLDLRHHRPARPDRLCAAKFAVRGFSEGLRHELAMASSPVRLSVVHPGGVRPTSPATPASARHHRQCAPRGSDRPLRRGGQDHAAGRRPAHHHRHREEPAAHPDRQRRPVHGPAAALSPRDVLGGAGEQDREDGGEKGK